ncbi:hypothetical protein [uncultured Bradyrhizobium sp.]|jgi:hypothetical protein|uniref:hypothetical protein n=1 Tax=uncultured Bradyrhizobium sp. TaxID=199684 RepID=UPI002635EA4F|nr:hypothetical protein [uncultured Bradyrhizobium sp.]
MAISIRLTIGDEGQLASDIFSQLIARVENTARNSATIVAIRLADELNLPSAVIQLLAIRISTHPDSLFWISEIHAGSKIITGALLASALITTVLNNTIGESLKEGWRHTETHKMISASVPQIEKMVISEFKRLFDRQKGMPLGSDLEVDPVAILRDEKTSIIKITARQLRSKPRF